MEQNELRFILYSIAVGILFILIAFLISGSLILLYPITLFYLAHRLKIWEIKKRAKYGTLAIVIVCLTSLLYYPISDANIHHYYDTYQVSGADKTILKNVTFNTLYPVDTFYLNITTSTYVHSYLTIKLVNETSGNLTQVMAFYSNSTFINGVYVTNFSVNVKNLSSGIYITNVSLNNGSANIMIYAPRMISPQLFNSVVERIVLLNTLYIFVYFFLMSEIFFLLIIFGAHMMRKGRQTISKQQ